MKKHKKKHKKINLCKIVMIFKNYKKNYKKHEKKT